MTLKLRSFFLVLIFLAAAAAISAQDNTRLSATWQVQKYDLSVALPVADADRAVAVKAKLELKNVSAAPASTLTLRISSLAEIGAAQLNGSAIDVTRSAEKINSGLSLQRVVARVGSIAPGGAVTLTLDYKLSVKENSGVISVSPNGAYFLPMSFWYPTPNSWFFPRGADSAATRISVTGAKNVVLASGTESGPGIFEQKLRVQPFLISGNFEKTVASGIDVYYPKGISADETARAAEIAAITSEAVAFTEKLLGQRPDIAIRVAAVKRGGGFSGGGTILIDDGAFRREKVDAQTVMNIADGVAKMWLGNKFSVSGDGYGAIREGLSKYIATEFIASKYGEDVADIERARQRAVYSAVVRREMSISQISPLDDAYYPVSANKGAMVWRLLAKRGGSERLFAVIRENTQDGDLTLAEVRAGLADLKDLCDYAFDQVTEMDLMAGLPQLTGGESKVALRNTGPIDVTVDIAARTASGEKLAATSTIKAKSFGEVVFKTGGKIERVEIDSQKLYPQTDYSDDVAPRETTENDLLLAVKRSFDKQEFAAAESTARSLLKNDPRFDEVRVYLGRSLLAQNKTAEAEREFKAVLAEKLPTARGIAWAHVGLADIAAKSGRTAEAIRSAEAAIRADSDYGASLAARNIRANSGTPPSPDSGVAGFFSAFDKAAAANRKADLEALGMPGEAVKFISGIAGQTVEWKTDVRRIDMLDADSALVEANLNIKLLNRNPESGLAVYRLVKVGGNWRLYSVDIFEVR